MTLSLWLRSVFFKNPMYVSSNVGFTASSIQSELDACKAAGMIEVLSKGLRRAQLQSFVSRYTQPAPQSDAVLEPCAAH